MRVTGRILSRLAVTRSLIACAALLAGAAALAQPADSGSTRDNRDETAMAIPRVALPGGNPGVALPRPLDPSEAARIRRIFVWQERGDIPAATHAAAEISDPLLAGHLLADRYLGRFHRSTPDELTAWLELYPDLPDAAAIHALLMRRLPKGGMAPAAPRPVALPSGNPELPPADLGPPANEGGTRSQAAAAARALFTSNHDLDALQSAMVVLHRARPDQRTDDAGIVAGLAAWRLGRTDLARTCFENAAGAASPARLRAAAAFWAARVHLRERDHTGYATWLARAAAERLNLPRTDSAPHPRPRYGSGRRA
jgi:soluble lytic murein transglycosylase